MAWIPWTGHLFRAGSAVLSTDRAKRVRHYYPQTTLFVHHMCARLQLWSGGENSGSHGAFALSMTAVLPGPSGVPGECLEAVQSCTVWGVMGLGQLRSLLKTSLSPPRKHFLQPKVQNVFREHQIGCSWGKAAGRSWGQTRSSAEGLGFQQFLEQEGKIIDCLETYP